MDEHRRLKWYTYVGDFINTLKAFIGTNYQALPFAFSKSGLAFGLGGVFVVATLTDHCCQLLLQSKAHLIEQICSRSAAVKAVDEDEVPALRHRLQQSLSYGDLGRRVFGAWCFHLIQFAVCFTQFCTCVAYFIFIGNTVYEMFPLRPVIPMANCTPANYSVAADGHPVIPLPVNAQSEETVHLEDLDELEFQKWSSWYNCAKNSVKIDAEVYKGLSGNKTIDVQSTANGTAGNVSQVMVTGETGNSVASNGYEAGVLRPASLPLGNITIPAVSTAPDLRLLILWALPVFLATSLLRSVRYLAPFSFVASMGLALGIMAVLAFVLHGFTVDHTFVWYRFSTLPLFLTQLISSYEGIGCILPIHCSMTGCRHLLRYYIHANVYLIFLVLCAFGALGYVRYGPHVEQLLVMEITQHTSLSLLVDATLLVSVLFTFPLQCFPVIEILEGYVFARDRCCGSQDTDTIEYDEVSTAPPLLFEENQSLLLDSLNVELTASEVSKSTVLPSVATWKRNILRIMLTLIMAGLAVVLRNSYAYVGAFTGAVGCSLLAYILPCMIDVKLRASVMPGVCLFKDIAIIVTAACVSIAGLIVIGLTFVRGQTLG